MKFGIVVIVALVAASLVAHFLLGDPGYVIINFRTYVIEMSVPVLVGLILSVLVGVWLLYRVLRLPRKLGEAAGALRSQRAGRQFTKGLIAAAEGKLAKGERLLTRGASRAETPLLNYLAAARVAHQQGATERRDNWLTMAYEATPGAANAVLLTQAELQLANGQFEQALATLRRIQENVPGHQQATLLLGRIYAAVKDYPQLGELLPALRKQGRIEPDVLDEWERDVELARLEAAGTDLGALRAVWKRMNDAVRRLPNVVSLYARKLEGGGAGGEAEQTVRKMLKRQWSGELAAIYGRIAGAEPGLQLRHAEAWLREHDDDPDLLLTAGRLCMREELWGKARSYLESALAIRPTPECWKVYGELLNELGEDERAANAYRSGLGMVAGTHPGLPDLSRAKGADRSQS